MPRSPELEVCSRAKSAVAHGCSADHSEVTHVVLPSLGASAGIPWDIENAGIKQQRSPQAYGSGAFRTIAVAELLGFT
jgi:hypothetical protein